MPQPSTDTIAQVPLLAGLERRELERVAEAFKERRFSAGDNLATEGQKGAGFFVIGEGTATVTVGGTERGKLGPGDYFGEIALIDEGARMATITAASELVCYGLTLWDFRPLVQENGKIGWKLLQALAAKLRASEQRSTA